jgi:hypothetical protein
MLPTQPALIRSLALNSELRDVIFRLLLSAVGLAIALRIAG